MSTNDGEQSDRSVTIVVPTYREVLSLPHLLDRIAAVRAKAGRPIDVLVMDDDSQDGSAELVAGRGERWVELCVRTERRGLGAAVLDGLRRARGSVLVCMDADLSHPPEALPQLLRSLEDGADFVLGSRYVAGGTTSDEWGLLRRLNSRVATWLARPLTPVSDPMSGFFALPKRVFERGTELSPVGYKIALELIVKCDCKHVVETPIHFEQRRYGASKLTLEQQLLYLHHLHRLYVFKYGAWRQLVQFVFVGGMGTAVNLLALTALVAAGLAVREALAAAIFASMCFNFVLHRRLRPSDGRRLAWPQHFGVFVAVSSVGAALNFVVALLVVAHLPFPAVQLAALCGIAAATVVNFLASRYLLLREAHVRAA
ncbi:MAG: glycosyltransferase family 2 protein [Myxococcales bacterium]|nr:MAG: glycosyltransferase family 2 protein [Myxococcales bacterium]